MDAHVYEADSLSVENAFKRDKRLLQESQRTQSFGLLEDELAAGLEKLANTTCLLVTAGPATGKTSLISQLVVHLLSCSGSVPGSMQRRKPNRMQARVGRVPSRLASCIVCPVLVLWY